MKAHGVVLQWVTDELASGRLHIGDHLPSERALSEQLGVARSGVREAFRVLEVLGAIRSSTGSGPSSGTIVTATPEQGLSMAIRLQLATRQVDAYDTVQLRILLESWCAQQADSARGNWAEALRILDRMDEPDLDAESFLQLDAEFHVVCSAAAENPLVSTLMEALRLTIAEQTLERAKSVEGWPMLATRLQEEHRAILASLKQGENERAAELLRAHISGYYEATE